MMSNVKDCCTPKCPAYTTCKGLEFDPSFCECNRALTKARIEEELFDEDEEYNGIVEVFPDDLLNIEWDDED